MRPTYASTLALWTAPLSSVSAENNHRMLIRIVEFNLQSSDGCFKEGLYLLDGFEEGAKSFSNYQFPLCGNYLAQPNYYSTSGKGVTIRFVSDGKYEAGGFRLYITSFTTDESCGDGKFQCVIDRKCITADAYCNGATQCVDASDEPSSETCDLAVNAANDVTVTGGEVDCADYSYSGGCYYSWGGTSDLREDEEPEEEVGGHESATGFDTDICNSVAPSSCSLVYIIASLIVTAFNVPEFLCS